MQNYQFPKNYKLNVIKVILAIGLFLFAYTFFFAFSIGVFLASTYAAYLLLSAKISYLTIILAIIIFGLGGMLFLFFIKIIFFPQNETHPYQIQIFRKDHPKFFRLIDEITQSIGTKAPEKIFISHDVNASVFYNSKFKSLFFSDAKNLDLGLGLVNSINKAELKAVLAHEFGHFSQKSMKIGSYVYNLNKIIYNMVYNYDRWDQTLENWINSGGVLSFLGKITYKIVDFIRFSLRKSYDLIYYYYMGLSREMEFHADYIAASFSGKEDFISALRRIEFSDIAFNQTENNLQIIAKNKKLPENLYKNHRYEIQKLSKHFKIDLENKLPVIMDDDLDNNTLKPRVKYEDQWTSHPSREERERRILDSSIKTSKSDFEESWSVFDNYDSLQQKMSKKIYGINFGNIKDFGRIDIEEYVNDVELEEAKFKINKFFEGYYDNRHLLNINFEKLENFLFEFSIEETINKFYSEKVKYKYDKIQSTIKDIEILSEIKNKQIRVRFFEFDNQKFHRKEAEKIIDQLKNETNILKDELVRIEKDVISMNLTLANKLSKENGRILLNKYKQLFKTQDITENLQDYSDKILELHSTIVNTTTWDEEELEILNRKLIRLEKNFKNYLKQEEMDNFDNLTDKLKVFIEPYLNGKKSFTNPNSIDVESLFSFVALTFELIRLLNEKHQRQLKKLTDLQIENYNKLGLNIYN